MEDKQINNNIIKIYKSKRKLELCNGESVLEEFNVGLGFSPIGHKIREGDGRTPEGEYYICTKNEKSKFTLFLGLSYPNITDAEEGFKKGLINKEMLGKINKAINNKKRPDWWTELGGEIGIHGKGSTYDWTAGCISLEDEDIKKLWNFTELGTQVIIYI